MIVALLAFLASSVTAHTMSAADWNAITHALKAYSAAPTSAHTAAVLRLLPTSLPGPRHDASVDFQGAYAQLEATIPALEERVLARNREDVRLTFTLLGAMGRGHVGEQLEIVLGRLIRIAPSMFLEELRVAHPPVGGNVDGLVGNLGPNYVDDEAASCSELRLRLKALEAVTNRSESYSRKTCTETLLREINAACTTPNVSLQRANLPLKQGR